MVYAMHSSQIAKWLTMYMKFLMVGLMRVENGGTVEAQDVIIQNGDEEILARHERKSPTR